MERVNAQCLEPHLDYIEKEEVLATVVYCCREDRAAAYTGGCQYSRLVSKEKGRENPGMFLVIEVGGVAAQSCIQEKRDDEAEKWLNLLTFLASSHCLYYSNFLHLAETLVMLLLRQGRTADAASRHSLWKQGGLELPPSLQLTLSLATGDCVEAMSSLRKLCKEEGEQGAVALMSRLLREGNVDGGTLRQLLMALQERDFFNSVALVSPNDSYVPQG